MKSLGLSRRVDLCITESVQHMSCDLGRSTVEFKPASNPDLTFRLTEATLVDAFGDPQAVARMVKERRIELVGAAADMQAQAQADAADVLTRVLRAAKEGTPGRTADNGEREQPRQP